MGNSRVKNSKRNISSGIISCISTIGLGFFIRTAVLYIFHEKYLGLTSVFSSIISVLNMSELGFSSAIIVSMYRPLAEGNQIEVCALLAYYKKTSKVIGSLILFLGIAVLPWIPQLTGETLVEEINITILYLLYLFDASFSYFLFTYSTALLTAVQRFDLVKNVHTITNLVKSILQIIMLCIFKNFYGYIAIMFFSTVASNIIIHRISIHKFPQFVCQGELEKIQKKEIHKRVEGLAVGKLAQIARNSFDTLIISGYLGLTSVAIYNNYFYVYNSLCSIMWAITTAMQAGVADSIVSENIQKNYQDLRKFEFIFNWIIAWCTSCLLCLYQPFMEVWVGKPLLLKTSDMILFCLYFYLVMINGIRNLYFDGNGLWWKGRKIAVYEMAANLFFNLILGKIFGITGVLIATVITILIFNYIGLSNILFCEYFQCSPKEFFKERRNYTLVTFCVCVVSSAACMLVNVYGILGLFLKLILCSAVSNIFLLLFYCKNKMFIVSFEFIKEIFFKKKAEEIVK